METIHDMATQAAKAVWQERNEQREPISGVHGHIPRGEPYDAGNMEDAGKQDQYTTSTQQDIGVTYNTSSNPYQGHDSHDAALVRPSSNHSSPDSDVNLTNQYSSDPPQDQHDHGAAQQENSNKRINASADAPIKIQPQLSRGRQRQIDGDRQEVTKSSDENEGIQSETFGSGLTEQGTKKDKSARNPLDHVTDTEGPAEEGDPETSVMGDGPKPVEIVAQENGGDAGNKGHGPTTGDGDGEVGGGGPMQERGTGELYVKTSGLAVDGGDFDASKPGAGKEADRLMEEKGMRRADCGGNSTRNGAASSGQDKSSLTERVKNKLHIN